MLLAVVLLYVGAVLGVNGIWLVGQARAAAEPVAARAGGAAEPIPAGAAAVGGADPGAAPAEAQPPAPGGPRGRGDQHLHRLRGRGGRLDLAHPGRGAERPRLGARRAASSCCSPSPTCGWRSTRSSRGSGRAFGWYCLFVAITAIPAGIYTLQTAGGNPAAVWLGLNWFAWAVLWALFFALLALERPIATDHRVGDDHRGHRHRVGAGLRGADRRAVLLIGSSVQVWSCWRPDASQQLADVIAQRLVVQARDHLLDHGAQPAVRGAATGRRGRPAPGGGRPDPPGGTPGWSTPAGRSASWSTAAASA